MSSTAVLPSKSYQPGVTLGFSLMSLMAAVMLGIGRQSLTLPILIIAMLLVSHFVTDRWGWFQIRRLTGYFGMLAGAAAALYGYWLDQHSRVHYGTANLNAVSNMLVYIQLPLMFQRKDIRLFEHWGVFLILEFVVAALLNDNALFGVLLIPTLVIGCSALILLAAYISQSSEDSPRNGTEAWSLQGWWQRWRGTEAKAVASGIQLQTLSEPENAHGLAAGQVVGLGSLLTAGVSLFALLYFFGLPRLHTGAYEGLGISRPLVGFSGTIQLDDIGELMANDELAMRLMMKDQFSHLPYQPLEPPYIRGVIADLYVGRGVWKTLSRSGTSRKSLSINQLRDGLDTGGQTIEVTIHEQTRLGAVQFSIPPFYTEIGEPKLDFQPDSWCLEDRLFLDSRLQVRQRYQFTTLAFQESRQVPFLVEPVDLQRADGAAIRSAGVDDPARLVDYGEPQRFSGLIALRDRILAGAQATSALEKVMALEDYLAFSNDFEYSLLPAVDHQNHLDPIEDFAANHRRGHCQYFASTLAIMLRTMGIPSRIVLGFRPSEYNDVGNFFAVRQRHAHAWVEAYLSPAMIQESEISLPEWVSHGIWLRLDPTPPGEGSNAGGSLRQGAGASQAYEAIEQFWEEGIMRFDSSRQPAMLGIFASSGNGPVASALRAMERFYLLLQNRNLATVNFTSEQWFSWPLVISLCLAAATALLLIRYRAPLAKFCVEWLTWRRRQHSTDLQQVSLQFFRRAMVAFAKLGWQRPVHQTPQEFVLLIQAWMRARPEFCATTPGDLQQLVETYYRLRYGRGEGLSAQQQGELDRIVQQLEGLAKQYPQLATKVAMIDRG
jgi:transglutaminase-like putative cysteine protease